MNACSKNSFSPVFYSVLRPRQAWTGKARCPREEREIASFSRRVTSVPLILEVCLVWSGQVRQEVGRAGKDMRREVVVG